MSDPLVRQTDCVGRYDSIDYEGDNIFTEHGAVSFVDILPDLATEPPCLRGRFRITVEFWPETTEKP